MGHCSLGKSVSLSSAIGWVNVAWVRVFPFAGLLGRSLKPGLECRLSSTIGRDTLAWVRVSH